MSGKFVRQLSVGAFAAIRPDGLSAPRVCHDCRRATSDYRCADCLARWRKKHGVVPDEDGEGGQIWLEEEVYMCLAAHEMGEGACIAAM